MDLRWEVNESLQLYAIRVRLLRKKGNLVDNLLEALEHQDLRIDFNDVLAVASKVVATAQNRLVKLESVQPSSAAKCLAKRFDLEPSFVEVVLQEADVVYGGVPKALLTLKDDIITPNAGVDYKNAPSGHVALWPKSPYEAAERIRKEILEKAGKKVGVIIVDSRVTPMRMGTIGLALAVAGFEPVRDYVGKRDLYGKTVTITRHAVADDLASAAHLLMGESAERTPAVLIKDAPVALSEKVDRKSILIPRDQDLFRAIWSTTKKTHSRVVGEPSALTQGSCEKIFFHRN